MSFIYLDFKKAFDSVAHNVTDTNWKWFQAYLTSRRQCVHFNNYFQVCLKGVSLDPFCTISPQHFWLVSPYPTALHSSVFKMLFSALP